MDTRGKWAIAMAVLGGIAASQGEVTTLPDILLGAGLNGGIAYGIGTLVISQKSKLKKLDSRPAPQAGNAMSVNYNELDIPDEMREFLQSLEIVPGRLTGWYKDPSNLYRLRYFQNGKWTLAVSDSESENEKSEALSRVLKLHSSNNMVKPTQSTTDSVVPTNEKSALFSSQEKQSDVGSKINQLERIAELRRLNVLDESEMNKLKQEILNAD